MEREETNEVLDYVMRSLDVLDETAPPPHPRRKLIGTVLKWLETAKCGSSVHRIRKLHYVFDTGDSGIIARARFSSKKGSFEPSP
jgi:hypothetical protein